MIKTNKIISIATLAMVMMVSLASSANAANLSWTSNTTITIGSASYTIQNGSTATSFVLSATALALVIPIGETFTLVSPDGYTIAASGADAAFATITCSGGTQAVITKAAGAATVTLTPSTATTPCVSRRSVTPTPTPTPTPEVTPTPASGAGATPTPTPTPTPLPGPATPAAPSGVTLYRVEGDHRVYVIKDGKKEWVKSADEFNAAGYKWEDIATVSADTLALYPDTTPSGVTLYRAEGDSKVYIVKDNVKQWIKTAEEFNSKGYKWSEIVVTTPSIVAGFSEDTVALVKVKVVKTSVLRVRKSNTTASAMLTTVKGSDVYEVMEKKSGWYKITTSTGVVGWISGAYTQEQ